jgi:hypothetical protein
MGNSLAAAPFTRSDTTSTSTWQFPSVSILKTAAIHHVRKHSGEKSFRLTSDWQRATFSVLSLEADKHVHA